MSTAVNNIAPEMIQIVRRVLDKHALGAARAAVDSAGLRVFLEGMAANDLAVLTATSDLELQCGMAAQISLSQDLDPAQREIIGRHAQIV